MGGKVEGQEKMTAMKAMNGNTAAAEAVRQVNPDVVVTYPAAPAAALVEIIASFAADGRIDSGLVNAESGYSALSACIGAAAAGGRVFAAAAPQEMAAMQEILFNAASLRLPIVAGVANANHVANTMALRDSGWIQLFSENPQEVYDNLVQAYKVAEHMEVRTPVMVAVDEFFAAPALENTTIEETGEINDFVGKFNPVYSVLDTENPVTVGSIVGSDYYFEHQVNQLQGIENARKVIKEIGKEFGDRFGRYYGHFESYKLEDADFAVVLMSPAAGTTKESVDRLRKRGEKVGVLKLRVFRPFPYQELKEALANVTAIAVLDRSLSPGSPGGPIFNEIRSALYDLEKKCPVFPYIYGLGGRDITMEHVEDIFKEIKEKSAKGIFSAPVGFINLR